MRQLWGLGAVVAFTLFASPHAARAQAAPPHDSAIDVQLFSYAIGPKTFFTVDNGDVSDKKELTLDAVVTFMSNPFTVYNTTNSTNPTITGQRDQVVQTLTSAQLTGAYGITDKIQIGANLPFVFELQGKGLDAANGMADPNGLQVTGLGDLLVEGKYALYQKNELKLAGIVGLTLPTSFGSDGSQFIGDDLPTGRGRLAVQWKTGRLSLGATAGVIFRKPRTVYADTIGQQITWGAAAAVALTDRFSLIGESYGRTGMTSFALDESPIEAIGGLRLFAATSVAVVVGGGAGLDQAIGAPTARFFISVGYAPDVRDSDGDGIPNSRDKCPLIPEDKDGFEDADGCPDDDNDKDGIPDKDDKCPNEAEDHDGFEDDDGCPDYDNDKDGIPDLQDKCPNDPEDGKPPYPHDGCPADKSDADGDNIPDSVDSCPLEPEDMDGFEDGDGCPDLDNDGDGIPDDKDKCPLCPEDKDGFEDSDGCPDLDNDHDGIPDAQDACPNQPETVNGVQDADGCPDTGGIELVKLDGDRLQIDKVPSLDGRSLSKAGEIIAGEMALIMRGASVDVSVGHPVVTKWLIAVSMKDKGDAQRIGDAVRAYLAKRGLANVEVLAAAGPPKIGGVVQERSDADAPFVCPANLEVKQRPDTITPKATMTAPSKPTSKKDAIPPPDQAAKPDAPKPDDKPADKKPDDVDIDMGN